MARNAVARSLLQSRISRPSLQSQTLRPAIAHLRSLTLQADDATDPKLRHVDTSRLSVQRTTTPKELIPNEQLVFGRHFTDHMLTVEWTAADGWLDPKIVPYQNFSLDPATCVFHYAFTCFEGTKAYRDKDGKIRMFRLGRNMERINKSAARIALPTFDTEQMGDLIKEFVKTDERFVPNGKGYSLYLRPTLIGTQRTIGVGPPGSALFYCIASPVGPYYPTGFKAISLEATTYAVRAWPGGVGNAKLGANYAPCIVPQMMAAKRGFSQNLWLFTENGEEYVTEVGTMNLFTAWVAEDGVKEIVTAPLDGMILEGIVRDSALELMRERLVPEGWRITERKYTMKEIDKAASEGRMLEAFGTGTAAVVSPVRSIGWRGKTIDCGLDPGKEAGPVAQKIWDWMSEIYYGELEHPWSIKV